MSSWDSGGGTRLADGTDGVAMVQWSSNQQSLKRMAIVGIAKFQVVTFYPTTALLADIHHPTSKLTMENLHHRPSSVPWIPYVQGSNQSRDVNHKRPPIRYREAQVRPMRPPRQAPAQFMLSLPVSRAITSCVAGRVLQNIHYVANQCARSNSNCETRATAKRWRECVDC